MPEKKKQRQKKIPNHKKCFECTFTFCINFVCHLESDRQKLLGIIEQGFGDCYEFNDILRHIFKKRRAVLQSLKTRRWSVRISRRSLIYAEDDDDEDEE